MTSVADDLGPHSSQPSRRFGRELRLRKTGDYRKVQGAGLRVRQAHLMALFLPGESACSRVGITVSRKVGGAVTRNRVKRWLREAIRHEAGGLTGVWDVVLIAHPSAAESSAAELRAQVRRSFLGISSGRGQHQRRRTRR